MRENAPAVPTGATGAPLLQCLLQQDQYEKVVVFTRRDLGFTHPKLCAHCVDFDAFDEWRSLLVGDDVFSTLGTTLAQAGSKAAQYKVDYTYQAQVIEAARELGATRLFLVSSPMADASSKFFYVRLKGQLEDFALAQNYPTSVIFRPSVISAPRPDGRTGEAAAIVVLDALSKLPFFRRRAPIEASDLAKAIANAALRHAVPGQTIYELDEVVALL